ncbi:MAG: glycosyltransferase family 2 protein, partial [Chitinophagaceae bacterium]
ISVCIPAYKNAEYLRRCLDSLATQTFRDFELIISDDSPDESVWQIAEEYKSHFPIIYLKNSPALGTPANWNFAMQHAKGDYIKLMHDDDWFAENEALQKFYDCLEKNPGSDFCFSAFHNVHLDKGTVEPVFCSALLLRLLKKDRYNLFKRNFIGPPSVVFQRNNRTEWYDDAFKWLVDFEGYIRFLDSRAGFVYIDECLVNIGLSGEQVTTAVQHDAAVVLPESIYFLEKHGPAILKNIFVYDYYWRMLRNFSARKADDILVAGWKKEIPAALSKMIVHQARIAPALLKIGPLSKILMAVSKFNNRLATIKRSSP